MAALLGAVAVARRGGHAFIPLHLARVTPKEVRAVAQALRGGWLAGNGPIGQAMEHQLAVMFGGRRALLMGSCTGALEAALASVEVQGGEVILPSFAFASTAAAVIAAGAHPVFADVESRYGTLDPLQVTRALTARTRAIIFVEYAGHPGMLGSVQALAASRGIPLIEDAAQAFGSVYQNRSLGAWGTVGCISFHQTKLLTCGEGGLLVAQDGRLAERATQYREYGTNRAAFFRQQVDRYEWVGPGSSSLLAEPLAALLRERLAAMPSRLRRQRELAERYLDALAPLAARGWLQLPVEVEDARVNWHLFPVLAHDRAAADALISVLASRAIEARRHFVPLHLSAYARQLGLAHGPLPVTESVADRLVRLPIYPELSDGQQQRVLQAVRVWAGGFGPGRRRW